MPDRFAQKPDGRYEWRYDEATATYDSAHVRPTRWPMDLYGCRTEEDAGQPSLTTNTYTFLTADGQRISGQRCKVRVFFPQEASYEVRMEVTAPDGSLVGRWESTVEVKDLLIITLGDSYASGEGNPEYRRVDGEEFGDWVDDRCHRSSYAGAAQAAGAIERADNKTSVTFLSFACSGGTINRDYFDWDPPASLFNLPFDPYKPGSPDRSVGSGILGPYRGAQPPDPTVWTDKVPSQIDQLRDALAVGDTSAQQLRKVDALLMSAGGNDAGFGLLATACATQEDCVDPNVKYTDVEGNKDSVTLAERVQQDLDLMPARYDALAEALTATGLDIAGTYITEYPDPGTELRSDTGQVEECEEILEDAAWQLGMEVEGRQNGGDRPWGTELGFARNSFLAPLNAVIGDRAAAHGWQYVGGISDGFFGHGYCVGPNDSDDPNRYIQTGAMSERHRGCPGLRGT